MQGAVAEGDATVWVSTTEGRARMDYKEFIKVAANNMAMAVRESNQSSLFSFADEDDAELENCAF